MINDHNLKEVDSFVDGRVRVGSAGPTMVTSVAGVLGREDVTARIIFCDREPQRLVIANKQQTIEFTFIRLPNIGDNKVFQLWRKGTCVATVAGLRVELVLAQKLIGDEAKRDLRLASYRGDVVGDFLSVIEKHFSATATVATGQVS